VENGIAERVISALVDDDVPQPDGPVVKREPDPCECEDGDRERDA
jgi:hypothetical protein